MSTQIDNATLEFYYARADLNAVLLQHRARTPRLTGSVEGRLAIPTFDEGFSAQLKPRVGRISAAYLALTRLIQNGLIEFPQDKIPKLLRLRAAIDADFEFVSGLDLES